MNIQTKSSNGITLVPMNSELLKHRMVFIEEEITSETACEFAKQILLLNRESSEPINVLVNSEGGEINAGLLMYDVIQGSRAPIRMICFGRAYSMAAVLFASGNHGRFMLPHGELMLHEPLLGNRVSGSSSSIKSVSDSLQETKRKMNRILARHTGKTEEEVEKETAYDHYFSPEESIAFGLCDRIIGFEAVMGEPACLTK